MSMYINGYLRVSDEVFVPLFSYSRSSDFYSAAEHLVPYEKVRGISPVDLKTIRENLEDSIKAGEALIKRDQESIDNLLKMNNDIDEKLEVLNDYMNSIEEIKAENAYLPYWIGRVDMLLDIIEENKYSKYSENLNTRAEDDIIYMGIESPIYITAEDIDEPRKD